MSLPWSACIQTFSDSFYSHSNDSTPLTGRSQSFRVSDGSHQILDDRPSLADVLWWPGQMSHHSLAVDWGKHGRYCGYVEISWDIMVRILCLDPQMACFLPISVGVCRSKPGWIHQPATLRISFVLSCSSFTALNNKQHETVKGISKFRRAEMGEPVLQCGSMYSIIWRWNTPCNLWFHLESQNSQNSEIQ